MKGIFDHASGTEKTSLNFNRLINVWIKGKDVFMSTMQEFYDNLLSTDQPKDPDWQKIKQVVNASLDQLTESPDELGWYYWTASPEMSA